MLMLTETTEYSFLFKVYRHKELVKELDISKREIVTSGDLPGLNDKHLNITLNSLENSRVQVESSKTIMINGVECRKKVLKAGDTLQIGQYRIVFMREVPLRQTSDTTLNKRAAGYSKKIGKKEPLNKKKPGRHPFAIFAEAAIVLFSLFFLWVCATQKHVEKLAEVNPSGTTISIHETPPPKIKEGAKNRKPEAGEVPSKTFSKAKLVIYAPNDVINPEKLDILFIHAHPDDETLDYGLSISRASAKGLKVGVLTFTDGESGFDFYPDREVTGIYPDRELHGKDLAAVRVKEEANALKVLGADLYIRLGLRNRPYTKEEVNKSLSKIIQEWGGKKFLINKLVNIFLTLSPDIIVSPDGPSKAKEHFEHEAVGYISNLAVKAYLKDYPHRLKDYLKLVDVQQTNAYPNNILMSVRAEIDKSDIYRKKKAALGMYQTQADASYYGIRRLKNFPKEYYFFQYQSSDKLADMLFGSTTRKIKAPNS